MSAGTASLERSWTRQRFRVVLIGIFLLQLGVIFFLGRKTEAIPAETSHTTSFRMLVQKMRPEMLSTLLVNDPALFVVPGYDSFSGAAWMKQKDIDYSLQEWSEPPRWLMLPQEKLTASFRDFIQANQKPYLHVAEKKAPLEPAPVLPTAPNQSNPRITLEGDIARRFVGPLPELNPWQGVEPLDRSIVQVAVNEVGQVVSARLVSRSGMPTADQNALRLAAALRFTPVAVNGVVWGRIIFPWRTDPLPPSTNAIPTAVETR